MTKMILPISLLMMASLSSLLSLATAADSVDELVNRTSASRISIQIPFDLHKPRGEHHSQALFGFQSFKGSMAAPVYVYPHDLCDPIPVNQTAVPLSEPFIMLAEGAHSCSAVTKARKAMFLGASALVFAHHVCACDDEECVKKFGKDHCDKQLPIPVGDGSENDISIPYFLLNKLSANYLKEQDAKKQPILMELTWGLPPKLHGDEGEEKRAVIDLWTTAHDDLLELHDVMQLRTITTAFAGKVVFAPHLSIIDGTKFQCDKHEEANGPCDHLCSNKGKYCALHAHDLSGHAIVQESLRRLCIWKHHGEAEIAPKKKKKDKGELKPNTIWWDYLIAFMEDCSGPHHYADKTCVDGALEKANIDAEIIEECMEDSGGLDDGTNTILSSMITLQMEAGVVQLPALSIEKWIMGPKDSLFSSICDIFLVEDPNFVPAPCYECSDCDDEMGCLENGKCVESKKHDHKHEPSKGSSKKKKSGRGWKITFWLFAFAALIGAGVYFYIQKRDEFGGPGNRAGLLNNYFQLSGEEG